MSRDSNKGCDFAKGQKIGSAEAIINLNLSCKFSSLSVSVCSVAWALEERVECWHWKRT